MTSPSDGPPGSPPSATQHAFDYWLDLLRDGSATEQARARTEIGIILEGRGQLEAAADAYLTNVNARVRDRRPYERLAAICRQKGESEWEARVLLAMHAVFAESPPPGAPALVRRPRVSARTAMFITAATCVVVGGLIVAGVMLKGTGALARILSFLPASLSTPVTASGLPCTNPVGHFPEWANTRSAVDRAAREGIPTGQFPPEADRALRDAAAYDPDQTIAAWIATNLAARHGGSAAPPLPEYVAAIGMYRVHLFGHWRFGPSADVGRFLPQTIPVEIWQRVTGLPNSDCVGAMLKHPANALLVRLMEAAVIRP